MGAGEYSERAARRRALPVQSQTMTQHAPPFRPALAAPRHWPAWLGLGAIWIVARLPYRVLLALGRVMGLTAHPAFDPRNPNRLRALVSTFATSNPARFHDPSGAGYRFLADQILALDAFNPMIAARLVDLGARVGVATRFCGLDSDELAARVAGARVLINTIPADAAARYAATFAPIPVLLDAIYDPWPTPLAAAVAAAGGRVISGVQMLLHQACAQVELFTGLPAPREAMAAALG